MCITILTARFFLQYFEVVSLLASPNPPITQISDINQPDPASLPSLVLTPWDRPV